MMVSTSTGLSHEVQTKVATELQVLLADLIDLSLQGKQAHWNVVGPLFQSVHVQLDSIVDDARMWADDVAERKVTIDLAAHGQPGDVASESRLEPLPKGYIADREAVALMESREWPASPLGPEEAAERLGELDIASQDLVIEIVRGSGETPVDAAGPAMMDDQRTGPEDCEPPVSRPPGHGFWSW